jgi:hypothetical protein
MNILTLDDAKAHMNVFIDDDDALITNKIAAAEAWIGEFVGQDLSTFDPLPQPIFEATRQLVSHLYNNRDAALIGTNIVQNCPGLFDLLAPYRTWTF